MRIHIGEEDRDRARQHGSELSAGTSLPSRPRRKSGGRGGVFSGKESRGKTWRKQEGIVNGIQVRMFMCIAVVGGSNSIAGLAVGDRAADLRKHLSAFGNGNWSTSCQAVAP